MAKQLVVVINKNIELGRVMNALGHMSIGFGKRIPTNFMPSISIYAAADNDVSRFRERCVSECHRIGHEQSFYSDFAHTTTEGSARDHEAATKACLAENIGYYAACLAAEEVECEVIHQFLQECGASTLIKAESIGEMTDTFDFESPILGFDEFVADDASHGFSIALQRTLSETDALVRLIQGTVQLGQLLPLEHLRLHHYVDASGSIHPGMSEYGLVVLKGKKTSFMDKLVEQDLSPLIGTAILRSSAKEPLCVALFGEKAEVKKLTKNFS